MLPALLFVKRAGRFIWPFDYFNAKIAKIQSERAKWLVDYLKNPFPLFSHASYPMHVIKKRMFRQVYPMFFTFVP